MGLCSSINNKVQKKFIKDRALDEYLRRESAKDSRVNKLLLLGAGESGKSTLFKQMTLIYGQGFPEKERMNYRRIIHSNTISAMQTLCKASDELAQKWGHQDHRIQFRVEDQKALRSKKFIMSLRPLDDKVSRRTSEEMKTLWNDRGIQNTFGLRGEFNLPDSADYFFGRLDEMCKSDYLPNMQDVLRSRVRTTGILEQKYKHSGVNFHVFDVGGQRNERTKWIHLFENVTAVIFVASLSSYDQMLYESRKVNRMHESLDLFEELANLKWFKSTSLLLFLNKKDLFQKKIKEVDLRICFEDYDGESDWKEAAEFVRQKYVERISGQRVVYAHITNATDTRNMQVVFNTCQDIIIRKCLHDSGLMRSLH
mmetsp:Transcript_28798/g.56073  ORF Transcript_28798/g.56073 Transcript_28798/m.56073 type:complete len:368 (+) Transcript_28798:103-1206(+)